MINKVFVAQLQIHYKLQVNINYVAAQRMKRRDAGEKVKKRRVVLRRQGSTHEASQEKPRGADPELSPGLGVDTGPDGHDRGRAS